MEWKKICTTVLAVQKGQIYVKVLCLVIVNVNVPQKCQIWQTCGYQVRFFQTPNTPKLVFGGPRCGSLSRSPTPSSRLGRGTTVLAVQGTNIYVKVLCLVIVNVNVTKYVPQKCQI